MKTMKLIAALLVMGWAAHAADTASVSGKVTFDGVAPKAKKIKTDSDPQCQAMHADSPLLGEEVVVGDGGGLKNVFVYIKSGVKGEFPCPKEPVKIERDLMELIPKSQWVAFSHRVIHHGRRLCTARNPKCDRCPLRPLCPRIGVEK